MCVCVCVCVYAVVKGVFGVGVFLFLSGAYSSFFIYKFGL